MKKIHCQSRSPVMQIHMKDARWLTKKKTPYLFLWENFTLRNSWRLGMHWYQFFKAEYK